MRTASPPLMVLRLTPMFWLECCWLDCCRPTRGCLPPAWTPAGLPGSRSPVMHQPREDCLQRVCTSLRPGRLLRQLRENTARCWARVLVPLHKFVHGMIRGRAAWQGGRSCCDRCEAGAGVAADAKRGVRAGGAGCHEGAGACGYPAGTSWKRRGEHHHSRDRGGDAAVESEANAAGSAGWRDRRSDSSKRTSSGGATSRRLATRSYWGVVV